MTKKISLTLAIDGTGNNKTNNLSANGEHQTDNRTNVAKIHEMIKADAAFVPGSGLTSGRVGNT